MSTIPRKIHIIGGDTGYANWMEGTEYVSHIKEADLVVLTGGADINPKLYGREKHPKTYFIESRDVFEVRELRYAISLDKPIVGICRGAQLLCAQAGGTLIQDQDDPNYFHDLTTWDHKTIPMTSMHHQAMFPWHMPFAEYKVLAWTRGNSTRHEGPYHGHDLIYTAPPCMDREVEICYFPYIRGLAIQGHPEMMYRKVGLEASYKDKERKPITESIAYCRDLLNRTIAETI